MHILVFGILSFNMSTKWNGPFLPVVVTLTGKVLVYLAASLLELTSSPLYKIIRNHNICTLDSIGEVHT